MIIQIANHKSYHFEKTGVLSVILVYVILIENLNCMNFRCLMILKTDPQKTLNNPQTAVTFVNIQVLVFRVMHQGKHKITSWIWYYKSSSLHLQNASYCSWGKLLRQFQLTFYADIESVCL